MSRRILLADDSVTIQKVIELTFAEQDYEIVSVSDGTSAITALTESRPDLVVADVHMPGASGFEVCRLAKELHPGLPVVLMVGTFEPFEEADASAAGADTFLKKPFDSQELVRVVGDLISRNASGAAAAPAWEEAWPAAEPAPTAWSAPPAVEDLPPAMAFTAEAEEEVDLESWDKLEIAAAEGDDDDAGEPVWGNFDASLDAVSLEDEPLEDLPAAEPSSAYSAPAASAAQTTEPFAIGLGDSFFSAELETTFEAPSAPPAGDLFEVPAARLASHSSTPAVAVAPPVAPAASLNGLSDEDVDRVARRMVELLSDKVVRDIAWEVIPDVAELVIKDRIRELEAQVDGAEP